MRTSTIIVAVVAVLMLVGTPAVHATPVVIGGLTFDSDAFPTQLRSATGTFYLLQDGAEPGWNSWGPVNLPGNASDFITLESSLTGHDLDTAGELHTGAVVDLGWGALWPANGPGADLVVYEMGHPEPFTVQANGITLLFTPVDQGFYSPHGGLSVNAAFIDLEDFGLASGHAVDHIVMSTTVTGDEWDAPDIGAVGAINTVVPEPATLVLLAVAGTGLLRKRRQR